MGCCCLNPALTSSDSLFWPRPSKTSANWPAASSPISFERLDAISRDLAVEIENHCWPLPPGDDLPFPSHLDPNLMAVPPSRDELERLEATAPGAGHG